MNDYSDIAKAEARIVKSFFAYRNTCIANRVAKGEDPNTFPFSISLYKLQEDISAIRHAYDEYRKEDLLRKYNARKALVLELAIHELSEEEIHSICKYDPCEIHRMLNE